MRTPPDLVKAFHATWIVVRKPMHFREFETIPSPGPRAPLGRPRSPLCPQVNTPSFAVTSSGRPSADVNLAGLCMRSRGFASVRRSHRRHSRAYGGRHRRTRDLRCRFRRLWLCGSVRVPSPRVAAPCSAFWKQAACKGRLHVESLPAHAI